MGEMVNNGGSSSAGIDLSQFYQVFFEEAGENLEQMEQKLLELNVEAADDEELNAIFRCAHSVKGGAATFGFADVAALTHQMETLLDKLRRHAPASPTPPPPRTRWRRWGTSCAATSGHRRPRWSTCCSPPATR